MPHLVSVFESQPHGELSPALDETFRGRWEERNWRNVPGPFYGAMTDNCWIGRLHAPRHVLYGDDADYEQEFLTGNRTTPTTYATSPPRCRTTRGRVGRGTATPTGHRT
jgi:hypothetical protein